MECPLWWECVWSVLCSGSVYGVYTLLLLYSHAGTVPEKGILYPHGNAKKSNPYIRTAPSVLKEAGETYKDPSAHYKETVAGSSVPSTHEATLKPRNPRQVKNAQAQVQKERREKVHTG